jgi:formamidase
VAPGTELEVGLRDGFDGQITPSSTADDVERLELYRGHALTGPIAIEGAEEGDVVELTVVDITPSSWGFTAVMPGVGPVGRMIAEPYLAHWALGADAVARSEQVPGVAIAARPFLGIVGVAPSQATIAAASRRERALAAEGHLVALPDPRGAVPRGEVAEEGIATLPPRRFGGNIDAKQLTAGSTISLRAEVPGGLLSLGDPHLAQGDGESGGTAIEVSASARVRVGLGRARDASWLPSGPVIRHRSAPEPAAEHVVTTGVPRDGTGYADVYDAACTALEEMVAYLVSERGYSAGQAAVILSVAVDLRIAEIVNVPNPLVTASLPLGIFD